MVRAIYGSLMWPLCGHWREDFSSLTVNTPSRAFKAAKHSVGASDPARRLSAPVRCVLDAASAVAYAPAELSTPL